MIERSRGGPGPLRCTAIALLLVMLPAAAEAQHRPAWPVVVPPATPMHTSHVETAAAAGEMLALQSTGRHTKRGLIIGAIAGSLGGLAFGTLIHLFCETEGDDCGAVIPIVTVLGAASGAAAGAIIGAAIPRNDGGAAPAPEAEEPAAPDRRIGSFNASFGYANGTIDDGIRSAFTGSGPTLRLGLMAELRPWFAIGPELGQAWLGPEGDIRHAALALRLTWERPRIAPYVHANLGLYQTTGVSREFLGGGLGVGARFMPFAGERFFFDVEARASRHTQNIEPMRMKTLSAGAGVYW